MTVENYDPIIPDEQFEFDRRRAREILQEVISSTRIVGFRTRLVFQSEEAATNLLKDDQYLNLNNRRYAGTELQFNPKLPPEIVETVCLEEDQIVSTRTFRFVSPSFN